MIENLIRLGWLWLVIIIIIYAVSPDLRRQAWIEFKSRITEMIQIIADSFSGLFNQ